MPSQHVSLFPAYPQEDQRRHRAAVMAALARVVDGGNCILGPETEAFEAEFAASVGTRHAVGVGSGTDAIEVLLRALEIGAGSKVVLPAHGPSAIVAAVRRSGAEAVFADIEAYSFTLCPASLDALLRTPAGKGARAVLAVHLYGHPADWGALRQVAESHGLLLLEDGAQAHGAAWQGRQIGALGVAAAFSFYPTKNLAACGDAGAIACDDGDLAEKIRRLRQYGWRERHVSETPGGVNSRLDEAQAAVLRVKLPFLAESVTQRQKLAAAYEARLGRHEFLKTPGVRAGCGHARHQYVVRSPLRDELLRHLETAGIPVAVHYPVPLHRQPAYATAAVLPEAESAAREVLSLPLHPYLPEEAVSRVCDVIDSFAHAAA